MPKSLSRVQAPRILSTGRYLPNRVLRNEDLVQFPTSRLPMIRQKTGILERRHASLEESTSDLAAAAGLNCLQKAGFPAEDVDAIIVATSSPDRIQPATATRVQHLLGATRAFAFDVNSVCAGSVYAMVLANSLILSKLCSNVLVIGAETYSRFLNPDDFSTYPYFGDGAGSILLSSPGSPVRHWFVLLGSDGSGADVIQIPAGGALKPSISVKDPRDFYFRMNGSQVFDFAVFRGSETLRELLSSAGIDSGRVNLVVPHQASVNVIDEIARRSGISREVFFVNLDRYGNTAAASVLIALDEALESGRVRSGDRIALVAFGGGLSWGGILLEW